MAADKKRTLRIKMLTSIAGRTTASAVGHATGDVVDIDAEVAQAWIEEGMATLVRDDPKPENTAART